MAAETSIVARGLRGGGKGAQLVGQRRMMQNEFGIAGQAATRDSPAHDTQCAARLVVRPPMRCRRRRAWCPQRATCL